MVSSVRLRALVLLATALLLIAMPWAAPAGAVTLSGRAKPSQPAAGSAGDLAAQRKLALRYAPVVRLVDSSGLCGVGEPFQPANVDVVLGNSDVALRGPWSGQNLVKVAPTAADISVGLSRYNLDFPGNALSPGCTYADWAAQIQGTPTVYSHVVTQPSHPGRLALQYWFFYLYNDFNDKHEGDWEMIQLDFKADSASRALTVPPYEAGYSQHEAAERAQWGADKLELVEDTHPVVYPALGSHADYYSDQLYLGHSGAEGVGCDDTIGPSRDLRPAVVVLPQSAEQALRAFPWLGFQGRWGEKQRAFNNGPTGPSTKSRWSEPFTWVDQAWRDKAFAVPDGGLLGHSATSFFCAAVSYGSALFNAVLNNPSPVIMAVIVATLLVIWLASRTEWGPAVAFRVRRRRSWGAMVTSAMTMYRSHPRIFGGIGLLFLPLGLIAAAVQYLVFDEAGLAPLVRIAGQTNPVVELLVGGLGGTFALIGLTVVQAATAYAVSELDAERSVTARTALRHSLSRWRNLLVALVIAGAVVTLLSLTVIGAVIACYLIARWSLLAQAVILGGGRRPLRQSFRMTRGHFWRTASVTVFVTLLCLLIGPLVGTLLLFATSMPFVMVNAVAALVDAVISPLIAITTTYLYFDLEVRAEVETSVAETGAVLPAEI